MDRKIDRWIEDRQIDKWDIWSSILKSVLLNNININRYRQINRDRKIDRYIEYRKRYLPYS